MMKVLLMMVMEIVLVASPPAGDGGVNSIEGEPPQNKK